MNGQGILCDDNDPRVGAACDSGKRAREGPGAGMLNKGSQKVMQGEGVGGHQFIFLKIKIGRKGRSGRYKGIKHIGQNRIFFKQIRNSGGAAYLEIQEKGPNFGRKFHREPLHCFGSAGGQLNPVWRKG